MAELLSPYALCSLADAQAKAPASSSSSGGDPDEWTRLVNGASDAFLNLSGREFVAGNATRAAGGALDPIAPEDRVFSARELVQLAGEYPELELGDAADVTAVSIASSVDGTVTALAATDYRKLPRRRRYPWEPLEGIAITATAIRIRPDDEITVTGTWGFPAIPQDVREAVARTAAAWFARDTRRYGEVFSSAENTAPSDPATTHVLPRFAWETAMRYRRQRFA